MALEDLELIIFDGACGTTLQSLEIPRSAWDGYEGCNEYLNLTVPERITAMHRAFFEAGAQVVETNTFGANRVVLAEYGLQDRVRTINGAGVRNARLACEGRGGRYVAGSVGPTTKLPSLGQISFDELYEAYSEQIEALLEAGVDALVIETCQDLLQLKAALISCFDALERLGRRVPVLCSVTVETTGTLLCGSDIAAVAATVEPFPVFSLGLNCATGPEHMGSHLRYLSRCWKNRISCMPNAGLPEVVSGRTVYPLEPRKFAEALKSFAVGEGVSILGGCCGTTPDHIASLCTLLQGVKPAVRSVETRPAFSSLYQAVEVKQEIPPLLIGERANANGSKRFREFLLADDYEGALSVLTGQEQEGAHLLDLCTAYAGRNELEDLTKLVRMGASACRAPLVIDSTNPECIEAALKLYPGRCLINSVNLEDGGAACDRVCRAAKRFGAAVVALTIDREGMAMTAERKLEVARAVYERAVNRCGLRPWDLFFDPLTFTVGSGDESLRDAAKETLAALRLIKRELPGVFTILGVSNVSFGLPRKARRILNSVFLHEAVEAGLDAAIVDAAAVVLLAQIPENERTLCLDLLYNRGTRQTAPPLERFLDHFAASGKEERREDAEEGTWRVAEEELRRAVVSGRKEGLEDLLEILLSRRSALSIINEVLVPAMRHVGELFGEGQMLLPFVLKSAEVMKAAVAALQPHLARKEREAGLLIVLATVQGDVHDIGKNLVDIILSNNGYRVLNLGIKVPAEVIAAEARSAGADLIGLSGLLVKSALVMKENLSYFKEAGLTCPVLLGGAALTPKFVAEECVPLYDGPVVYCKDAFAALQAVREFEKGALRSTHLSAEDHTKKVLPGPREEEISRQVPIPEPPFLGSKVVEGIDPGLLFRYVNEQALFRGRWGYRRRKMSAEDYRRLIEQEVRPLYERLKEQALSEGWLEPKVVYGYFRCSSEGERLIVQGPHGEEVFSFPRQNDPPFLCIADYFRTRGEGGDVAGFFVVTLGAEIGRRIRSLYEQDRYHMYLILHGFSVELTDALAEYWHAVMRRELGTAGGEPQDQLGYVTQQYRGSRYGFGYPACPDLEAHRPLFRLLEPERIGVTLTENMEMVPEQTTSAVVVHHPQAKYFAV